MAVSELESRLQVQEAKRQVSHQRLEDHLEGVNTDARVTREEILQKVEDLRQDLDETHAFHLAELMTLIAGLTSNPVLTKQSSEEIKLKLEQFIDFQSGKFKAYIEDVTAILQKFIDKYSKELDLQRQAREKELETLILLNRYLSQYV
jgi:hypothetical protein